MKRWLLLTSSEDGNPCKFLDREELRDVQENPQDYSVTRWLDEVPDEEDHNYWPDGDGLLLRIEVVGPAAPGTWRVHHPGIGVIAYATESEARVAAGTAGRVYAPGESHRSTT